MPAAPGVLLAHEEGAVKLTSVEGSREESNGCNPTALECEADRVVKELKTILGEWARFRRGKCDIEDIDHCEADLTKLLVNADQLVQSMKMPGVAIEPITQCIKDATTMLAQLGTFRDDLKTRLSGHTDHGTAIYYRLLISGDIKTCPDGLGESTVMEGIVAMQRSPSCNPRDQKQQVVDFYTPMLMDIVKETNSDLRLVGVAVDEPFYVDFVAGKLYYVMPELFSAHHAVIQYSPKPPINLPACDAKRFVGKLASSIACEGVHCIWNATWKIDMLAFGEMCKSLEIIQDKEVLPLNVVGVLFDKDEFWMVKSVIYLRKQEVEKCGWRQPGSRDRLVRFLRPSDPWMEAARILCKELNAVIVEYPEGDHEHRALVWSTPIRRVFRLVDGRMLKMTVGYTSDIRVFEEEHELMVQYGQREDISSFVFPVVEGSYRSGKVGEFHYGGYLLGEGGQPIAYPVPTDKRRAVAAALYVLHCHGVVLNVSADPCAFVHCGVVKLGDFPVVKIWKLRPQVTLDGSSMWRCLGLVLVLGLGFVMLGRRFLWGCYA